MVGDKPYTEVIRKENSEGQLYRLVIEVIGDDGDPVRYDYILAGADSNSSQTAIDVIYLNSDGDEVGGDCAAKYVDGQWQSLLAEPEEEEVHEDDIVGTEGMRILLARKYSLPEAATFDEIEVAEELNHQKKMAVLLGLPEDSDMSAIQSEAAAKDYSMADVSLYATFGLDLSSKKEFEIAVSNQQSRYKEFLREAAALNKKLNQK
jgi:hypothetical protein